MFDIIAYIREKILRRPKIKQELAGEELTEKQTTKLGYFLLYCMFGAIMASAQFSLSIIRDLPDKPQNIPYCVSNLLDSMKNSTNYYYSDNYRNNDCQISSTHPQFNFEPEYSKLKTPYDNIINYQTNIQDLESSKEKLKYNQKNIQQDYNTSLSEKIANEKSGLYNTQNIQEDIKNARTKITNIDSQITNIKSQIDIIKSQYKSDIDILTQKFNKANNDYKFAYIVYRFYVALLSFIFAIVIFTILYNIYIRQKTKNSPFTIIFSVATFAYGLILLQISVLFIWDIIPHQLLAIIVNLFQIFTPLVFVIQFLWPVLIVAIFGYLVYLIQKRLYSPENVLKRFITDKKCPNCNNGVDYTKPFCPLCSHEIQIRCSHCHEFTLKGMPYCASCGGKI